jgi:NAD(P)-dependent dehydrogenase (short-subunit alcohol dehydrogenase family)
VAHKAIFVTGGASGIGRAVAKHFAAQGWFVGLADIDEQGLAETAAMIPAGQSSVQRLDVRLRKDWDRALAAFWDVGGGRLDVLFNNAGVGRGGPFETMSAADHDLLLDVNLKGVIRGAEAGFAYLKKTPGSCMLSTCSAAGIYGPASLAVYGATKFGVRGLTEALDIEWSQYGIKVHSLMPGFIDTPLLDSINPGTNRTSRDAVVDAGLEISPVALVAAAAWKSVHGSRVHTTVGPTARRLALLARLAPGLIRNRSRKLLL